MQKLINAEVVSVLPTKIKIQVKNIEEFSLAGEKLSVGSYLRVSDVDDCAILAIVETFAIEKTDEEREYVLEAVPIGFLDSDGVFRRGGNQIAIPPTGVQPARLEDVQRIYDHVSQEKRFYFSRLAQERDIAVPVDGDRFFNKHIAVVGSTGSGKSHTVAKIIQNAVVAKEGNYEGLNNSHIVIFDIHSEYRQAFPAANYVDSDTICLPYWMMNGEELEELLVESGEGQAYNQSSLLRKIVTYNKQKHNGGQVSFDSQVKFRLQEVLNCIVNLSRETRNAKDPDEIKIKDAPETFTEEQDKINKYFVKQYEFEETKSQSVNKGTYNDGTLEKFISRIRTKFMDPRLKFMMGSTAESMTFAQVLEQLMGYRSESKSNVTIVDLSGVPFEVLSITVSLMSRVLFEYGYVYKRMMDEVSSNDKTPLLLVYEEAHKYVPKTHLSRYNASRTSIERIAKEGRKYGVSAMIVSQRPSEVSETIYSQCNNFIAMRLTNPDDQAYVKKLLPDSLGPVTDVLPNLNSGEAVLIGDAIVMPSHVAIQRCDPEPSSEDIHYLKEWKKEWVDVDLTALTGRWVR